MRGLSETEMSAIRSLEEGWAGQGQCDLVAALMQEIHDREWWLECDCNEDGGRRPLLTVAKQTATGTLGWRIMLKGRLEHVPGCAFYKRQRDQQYEQAWSKPQNVRPSGYFSVLKPESAAVETRPPASASAMSGGRTRPPALASLLWSLLDKAGLQTWQTDLQERFYDQVVRLRSAAASFEIAPDHPLDDLFFTNIQAWEKHAVHACVREADKQFPKGHRAQGFVCFFTRSVDRNGAYLRQARPAENGKPAAEALRLDCVGSVKWPSVGRVAVPGPYLFFGVVGKTSKKAGYELQRGWSQPVVSRDRLIAVDSHYERQAFGCLTVTIKRLEKIHSDTTWTLHKPVFEYPTVEGPCLPDFEILGYRDDQLRHRFLVEVMGFDRPSYLAGKEITHDRMKTLGPVLTMDGARFAEDLTGEGKGVTEAILSHLRQTL